MPLAHAQILHAKTTRSGGQNKRGVEERSKDKACKFAPFGSFFNHGHMAVPIWRRSVLDMSRIQLAWHVELRGIPMVDSWC